VIPRVAPKRIDLGSRATEALVFVSDPPRALELDTITARWQLALDAADRAVGAAGGSLSAAELAQWRGALVKERHQTAEMLASLARVTGVRPVPWLSQVPLNARMLGLPTTARACLFDLEGVLTDSARLHAWAWSEVFDEFLLRLAGQTGWQFIPFDRGADYRAYLDGRPRLEGVQAFLDSRGIHLPEGRPADADDSGTACGLARRKGEALANRLRHNGVSALDGARRYLEAAGQAGLKRAVVSASASAAPMLELAGLATLVEERVDADVIHAERLRARPAPDLLLVACRRLGVQPEEAVTFTHTAAGVAAGHAAGIAVIGVGDGAQGELLRGFGAERVVPSVSVLLDPRLSDPTSRPS
jgi:HAD superfamily hydrolase (TIGR01509 family)